MRAVHFSDLHGQFYPLPEADIYICTGDMLLNFPTVFKSSIGFHRVIIPEKEYKLQTEHFINEYADGKFRDKFLKTSDAPVICLRGNHDFVNLHGLFGGEVYEIHTPLDTFDILGKRFGGFRGIPYIAGEWADELHEPDLRDLTDKLSYDLDVVVTHAPPLNVMDEFDGMKLGIPSLSGYATKWLINNNEDRELTMCFGHIHGQGPATQKKGVVTFSNAATGYNILEI